MSDRSQSNAGAIARLSVTGIGCEQGTEDEFWQAIEAVRSATRDLRLREEALSELLASMSLEALRCFTVYWFAAYYLAYDNPLWAAAYTIQGGCSDGAFTNFRGALIMQGRERFFAAVNEPDSLHSFVATERPSDLFYESFHGTVAAIWRARDGDSGVRRGRPDKPTGPDWDEDEESLARVVPRLSAWAKDG